MAGTSLFSFFPAVSAPDARVRSVRRPGIPLTTTVAWVGVVLGHLLAYLLSYPAQGSRHLHLAVTGHTWTGAAEASLLALIPVILLTTGARSFRSAPGSRGSTLAVRLMVIQVPAFLAIEVMERGWSVGSAVSDPAVFVGLVLQPLVAVLAAWVLELFGRTVQALACLLGAPRDTPSPRSLRRPVLSLPPQATWRFSPSRLRAPPAPALR